MAAAENTHDRRPLQVLHLGGSLYRSLSAEAVAHDVDPTALHVFGRGTRGTIYAPANPSTSAYKIARDRDALQNNIRLTGRVHGSIMGVRAALSSYSSTPVPCIPAIKGWVGIAMRSSRSIPARLADSK